MTDRHCLAIQGEAGAVGLFRIPSRAIGVWRRHHRCGPDREWGLSFPQATSI